MTVQGPVKEQQPDGMSHTGGRGMGSLCCPHCPPLRLPVPPLPLCPCPCAPAPVPLPLPLCHCPCVTAPVPPPPPRSAPPQVEYFTLPYASVQAFAVETAGTWDCDAEWRLWTAVSPPPPPPDNGDGPPPPPPPGKHYLEHDLRKGLADPLALQRHLAARMLRARNVGAALQGLTLEASQPPPAAAKPTSFLDYMGQNASQVTVPTGHAPGPVPLYGRGLWTAPCWRVTDGGWAGKPTAVGRVNRRRLGG